MQPEVPVAGPPRVSLYQKLVPGVTRGTGSLHHKPSNLNTIHSRSTTPVPKVVCDQASERRVSYATPSSSNMHPSYSPLIETVDHAMQNTGLQPLQLPENMTRDDFTRAIAVATVSALRHQETHTNTPSRARTSAAEDEGGGGHDAPSWSRTVSASVLLSCTFLYAIIAGLSMCHVIVVVLLNNS